MSLRVWLPLNGNLDNQGLSDITTSGTPVFKTGGKISNQVFDLSNRVNFSCSDLANITTYSIAFWAKVNTDNSLSTNWVDVIGFTDVSTGGTIGYLRWETCYGSGYVNRGISSHDNATNATSNSFGSIIGTTKGVWYHITCVVDCVNNVINEYQNGTVIHTITPNGGHLNGNFWIGETGLINGEIQDVRIYDHALSPLEVKQISQGLILHYPLNRNGWGQENLLPCGGTYTQSSPWTTTLNRTDGYAFVTNSGFEATPGKIYTISVECDGNLYSNHGGTHDPNDKHWTFWAYISNINTTKNWQNGGYDVPINLNSSNNNYRKIGNTHVWTITLTDSQKYIGLRTNSYSNGTDNVTINWWNMKIEEGDKFTGWLPNSSSALATTLGLNDNIEYDTSGYGNNGTKVGMFNWTSDTPKYNVSTKFNGSNTCIYLNNFVLGNEWSYGMWFYHPTRDGTWTIITILNNTGSDSDTQFSFWYNNNENRFQSTANTQYNASIPAPTKDAWHHFFATFDGNILTTYIDGVIVNTKTITAELTQKPHLTIGGRRSGENSWDYYWKGKMSDYRVYCTALSADDVKSLYNNSAYIDNQGNLYGAVLREV